MINIKFGQRRTFQQDLKSQVLADDVVAQQDILNIWIFGINAAAPLIAVVLESVIDNLQVAHWMAIRQVGSAS